jgi:LPXTG-motif cell wall-anchored protein
MKMTNFYGTSIITINLPNSPAQTVAQTASSLPNTGPGSGVIIAAAIVAIGGFFYYRSRLIARESVIAIKSNVGEL